MGKILKYHIFYALKLNPNQKRNKEQISLIKSGSSGFLMGP